MEVKVTALLLHLGAGWSWPVNAIPRPLYPQERHLVPVVQDAGWAIGPVWTGVEILAFTGIQSLGLPTRWSCYTEYAVRSRTCLGFFH